MKFPSLVRLPKHRTFNYTPRFYDESKERIAKLKAQIEAENKEKSDDTMANYRSNIKFDRFSMSSHKKENRLSLAALRVIMFFMTLACVFAYVKLNNYENYVLVFFACLLAAYVFALRKMAA